MELPNTSVAFNASCLTSWPKCKASCHWISIFLRLLEDWYLWGGGQKINEQHIMIAVLVNVTNTSVHIMRHFFYYLTGSLNRKYSNYANECTVLDRENISSIRSSMVQAYAYFQLTCVNLIKLANTRINTQILAPDKITISNFYVHLTYSKQEHKGAVS